MLLWYYFNIICFYLYIYKHLYVHVEFIKKFNANEDTENEQLHFKIYLAFMSILHKVVYYLNCIFYEKVHFTYSGLLNIALFKNRLYCREILLL